MFIGRTRELHMLRQHYDSGKFEFIGIYGRRRVGKTALISEFTRGLPTGWCAAIEGDAALNLKILSQAVWCMQHPEDDPSFAPVFQDFRDALEAAFSAAQHTRKVLVIDEFPYLAKSYPSFASILQATIDAHRNDSQLYLILCGSSLSFMKEQLLDRNSPLYGRRTAQLELRPFDFFESRAFFPGLPADEALALYGMTGGIPLYLQQFSEQAGLSQNVASAFLDPSSILYEEPLNLIKQEVNKAAPYHAVLGAIANGASQHNEIATQAGLDNSAIDYYLKELSRLGIVRRVEPIVGGGRKAVWRIADNLFRFWYRFIRPRQSLVERGYGADVAERIVGLLPDYLGPVFEDICRDWLWRQLATGTLPCTFTDVGSWWGNDPAVRSQAEIDIVAVDDKRVVLLGECKWRQEPTGAEQLEKLARRAHLVGAAPMTPLWLFSRNGYTDGCLDAAAALPNTRLIRFSEMTAQELNRD